MQRRWWSARCRGVYLNCPSKQMSQRLLISALIQSRAGFLAQTKDQCSYIKMETGKKTPILSSSYSHCFSFLSLERSHQGDHWNVTFSDDMKMQHFQKRVKSLTSGLLSDKTFMEPCRSSPELQLMWLEEVWLVQASVCGKSWAGFDAALP